MKKIYLNYLLAHFLLMAFGGALMLLASATTAAGVSPFWALTLALIAAAAYGAGKKLRSEEMPEKNDDCWNAAMAVYIISLALLALLWKLPQSKTALFANVWNLSLSPALLGFDAWLGNLPLAHGGKGFYALLRSTERYHDLILPIMGAVLAAVEPLCLTLGFLTKKTDKEIKTDA